MSTHPNNQYNKHLQPFANKLRKDMTKAEACLWKYALRGKTFNGYQFRRQRPILNFIADFACLELKLVIELDGFTHTWNEIGEKDNRKQDALESAGFKVLRFKDDEVLNKIQEVIRTIQLTIVEIEANKPSPPADEEDSFYFPK